MEICRFHQTTHSKKQRYLNLINRDSIAKMKKDVKIINCARGGIINEADLAEAILTGQIEMAAIDVFDREPVDNSPLLKLGNRVVLTPHLDASTE